jgi:ribosomal protein L11 methyltransferase
MSLRLLEQVSRRLTGGWNMLDLGTGSGILALAAKRFGAAKVIGVDLDPIAVSTAKQNARLNRIRSVDFRLTDARQFSSTLKFHILTANLFSELLIEVLPKMARILRMDGCAILSGILRDQERSVRRALRAARLEVTIVRRRGMWIAILAQRPRVRSR